MLSHKFKLVLAIFVNQKFNKTSSIFSGTNFLHGEELLFVAASMYQKSKLTLAYSHNIRTAENVSL